MQKILVFVRLSLEEFFFWEYTDDIVCLSDIEGRAVYLNKRAREFFGIELKCGESPCCYDIFKCRGSFPFKAICPIDLFKQGENIQNNEFSTKINNEYLNVKCSPVFGKTKVLKYILHLARNVTETVTTHRKSTKINQLLNVINETNKVASSKTLPYKIAQSLCENLLQVSDYFLALVVTTEFIHKPQKIIYASKYLSDTKVFDNNGSKCLQIDLKVKKKQYSIEITEFPQKGESKTLITRNFDDKIFYGAILKFSFSDLDFAYLVVLSHSFGGFHEPELTLLEKLVSTISFALQSLRIEEAKDKLLKEIQEKERFYATLLSNLPGFVYRCRNDRNWTMEYLSSNFKNLTGYEVEEIIGNKKLSFNDLIHPDHQERLWVKWQIILNKREVFEDEYPIITKNGETRWVYEHGVGIYNQKGAVIALEGYIYDITERKKIEESLKESEKKYRTLFEASSDAIFLMISDTFVDCNFATLKMFECERKDIIGRAPYEFSPEYQPDGQLSVKKAKEYINRAYKGEELQFEWTHRSLKGREFECEVTLNRVVVGKNQYLLALVRDISSKKQALKEITHLAQAIQSIDEAVAIWDFNQNITFVNKAFERLFGYSIDEIIGKPISIIRSEETQKIGIDNEIIDTIKANKIWRGEVWNQTKEGKKILVGLTVSPFVDVNGEICACISVEIDLTERKMIEQKLHESNEMFNCLVNSIEDAIVTLDKENRITALYGSWKEKYPIEDKYILNKTPIEIFGEERGKIHLEMIERCYKQGSCTYEFEFDLFGFNAIIQITLSPLKDIEGNIIGLVGIGRDITKQKHLETELRKFMWTVEQSPISIVVTNLNGQILYANSFASKITGYSLDEIIGKNPRIFKSGLTPTKTYEELWGTLLRGETWSGEFANRKKNGEIYWESALITPLKDEKGRIINYIAIKRDITKEKELINELVEAKESAEQLNELKNYLLMNLSHEFRTPLNGIIGYSQYLMMTSDNSDLQQIARIIYISGHRLLYSVNLVIDFALQSAGYIKTKPTKFDIVELVRDVFEHWKFYFFDKEIETYIESNEPAIIVNLDETIARTIISNIINNAFKFTREGKVEVIINRIEKVGKGFVEIQVIDTGIGIPEDKIPLIWKEFYQVSQGMNREFEGQGLGLSVAKKYVKLLGGEIYVQSQLGKGSNFTILCPIEIED